LKEQQGSELRVAACAGREFGGEDFSAITGATGEIIARLDGLLHEAIYGLHPELRIAGPYRCDEQDL
jgi:hypothetical protein